MDAGGGDAGDATVADATDAYDAREVPDGAVSVVGTLSGLLPGDSVVLQDNGGDVLQVSANGSFTFANTCAILSTGGVD